MSKSFHTRSLRPVFPTSFLGRRPKFEEKFTLVRSWDPNEYFRDLFFMMTQQYEFFNCVPYWFRSSQEESRFRIITPMTRTRACTTHQEEERITRLLLMAILLWRERLIDSIEISLLPLRHAMSIAGLTSSILSLPQSTFRYQNQEAMKFCCIYASQLYPLWSVM